MLLGLFLDINTHRQLSSLHPTSKSTSIQNKDIHNFNMVSFKYLLLSALAAVSVTAQDPPTGDDAAAAAYWGAADLATASEGTPDEKRDIIKVPRNNPPLRDPYKNSCCNAPYTKPPCATTCNRNNCFRALLNARDGSDGKVCNLISQLISYVVLVLTPPASLALPQGGLRLLLHLQSRSGLLQVVGHRNWPRREDCSLHRQLQEQRGQHLGCPEQA